MPNKEIPKEGSEVDVILSEGESVTFIMCEFCNTNPCKCQFLICPFHGKVNAKKDRDGKYHCTKDCEITREENDLE